jgi:hypothetical protein
MKKQELIQQILILDNVGETEHLDLKKMKKNELEILYDSIFNFAHSRQNNWIKAFAERSSKEIS